MINQNFKQALKIIYNKLEDTSIKYIVVGSTNLALQGMDKTPNDIDIITEFKNLEKIKEIFKSSEIKKLTSPSGVFYWETNFKLNDIEISFMGEKSNGNYTPKLLNNKIKSIKLDFFEIPCLTLEAESQAYSETHREEKAKLIRDFLNPI